MELSKGTLRLRSAVVADAELLTKWNNDGQLMDRFGFPNGIKTTVDKIKKHILQAQTFTSQLLVVEIDNHPVGELLYDIIDQDAVLTLHFLDHVFLNKGYENTLLKLVINHLFATNEINKFVVDINVRDKYEQAIFNNLGFILCKKKKLLWYSFPKLRQKSTFYEFYREDYVKCKGLYLE